MIAKLAIVGDVGVRKQQIMRADPRRHIRQRAAMDRGIFPENIVIPDAEMGRLAEVFQILRLPADHAKREKFIGAAKFRMSFKDHVRMQHTIIAELDICTNDTIRPDEDILA